MPSFRSPTTFAGGTIDGPYGPFGGVRIQGSSWLAPGFPAGTHLLSTRQAGPFRLTFTNAVSSVQLDAQPSVGGRATVTLKAYDSSDGLVGSHAAIVAPVMGEVATLSVTSSSNNIKYFTVEDMGTRGSFGVLFTNVVWGCAA